MHIVELHTYLIGKICKVTELGVELAKEYSELFKIGQHGIFTLFDYCHRNDKYEIALMFVDEKPYTQKGITWFCVKEIGKYSTGDYHWLTLDQLIICN